MNIPLLLLLGVVVCGSPAHADSSVINQHPMDVITALWWALGILATFAIFVSSGVAIWAIQAIMRHEKEIAEMKATCREREKEGCAT